MAKVMGLSRDSAGSGSVGTRQRCDSVGAGEMGHDAGPKQKKETR
jgi:hypothetical protein